MAVVVNEMEVVPAPEPASPGAGSIKQAEKKPINPREVEEAIMKQVERRSRVRAH